MFEKVNPAHPDKVADRIAGAMVDLAYRKNNQPKIAVEVLIGHGVCHIITETSVHFFMEEVLAIVERIAGPMEVDYKESAQDVHLAVNQHHKMRCGDNGIFKGTPVTAEQRDLTKTAERIYDKYLCDGKYIITNNHLIICQSNAPKSELRKWFPDAEINPLGDWTGGTDVDTGATNRKLGSDMGDSITGGGLHGKDLSKADQGLYRLHRWFREVRGMGVYPMTTTKELQLVSVDKLIPYINNARTHSPEQVKKLRASLREFGFINPVIVDRDFNVIAGHGRILAAKEEGITEVPCVFADHVWQWMRAGTKNSCAWRSKLWKPLILTRCSRALTNPNCQSCLTTAMKPKTMTLTLTPSLKSPPSPSPAMCGRSADTGSSAATPPIPSPLIH